MPWYNTRDEQRLLADVASRTKKLQELNSNDAVVAGRLSAIYAKHPYISAGVAVSLAESNADQATIDQVAQASGIYNYKQMDNNPPPPDVPDDYYVTLDNGKRVVNPRYNKPSLFSWRGIMGELARPVRWAWENTGGRSNELKSAIRYGTAAAQFPAEYTANYFSMLTDPNQAEIRASADNWWELPEGMFASTSIGQMLQRGDESGEGFFLGGEAEKKRLEKVKQFRWQINGESYTVGRGTANMIFQPGSLPYRFLSGVVDAGITWYADPFNKPVQALSDIQKAKKVIAPLETAEEISAARKLAAGNAGLLSTAEQHAIDNSKFFNWLDNSRTGQRVVQRTVEETDKLKILRAYNGKISADQAVRLANAKTTDEVRGIIAEQAIRLTDEVTQGFVPFADRADQLAYSQRIPAYRVRQSSRWFTKVPKNQLIVHGTEQEKVQSIFNIENWLRTIKVDPTTGDGKAIIDKAFEWASETGTRVDADQMFRLFMGDETRKQKGIMWKALEANGVSQEVIEGVITKFRSGLDTLRKNAIDEHGMTDDAGFIKHMTQYMTDIEVENLLRELHPSKVFPGMTRADMDRIIYSLEPGQLTLHGPMSIADMLNTVQVLPDARMMRRLTTNPFFQLTKNGEQLRVSSIVETIQNDLWRPYALMSIGYIMRNTMDAQLRLGLHGFFSDPLQYLMIMMRKRGMGTVKGSAWVEAGEDIPFGLDDLDEYVAFSKAKTVYMVDDPAEQLMRMVKNGEATVVNTGDPAYISGFVDSARINYADPFMRLAAQIMHLPEDRQIDIVVKWLGSKSEEANQARRTIIKYLEDGPLTASSRYGMNRVSAPVANAKQLTDEELVEAWYEIAAFSQVEQLTLGRDELRVIAGYNAVPMGPSELWDEAQTMRFSVTGKTPKAGELLVEPVTTTSGKTFYRNYLVMEVNGATGVGPKTFKVIEVRDVGNALSGENGSQLLRKHLEDTLKLNNELSATDDPVLPTWVRNLIRTKPEKSSGLPLAWDKFAEAVTFLPRWFFDVPVQKWQELAEKSPAFRLSYYQNVAENARLLSPSEAQKLMRDLDSYAARVLPAEHAADPAKAVEKYIGGRRLYEQLNESIDKAMTGTGQGTVEQLHTFSATKTKADLEDLFFNNLERANITDTFRVIAPFAAAWAEVAGRYSRELIQNPARIRKAQLLYRGMEGFDPDGDGRGFIYRDPQSGDMMFTFPLYGRIASALTGVPGVELVAPVKQLSAGLAIVPSVGPMFQIAATQVFNTANVPSLDSFRKFLMPYGDAKVSNVVPGTWQKLYSALVNRPDQMETIYGNTYADLFAFMSTTGEYDLNDSEDVQRLHEDAKIRARGMALIRAASQFIGPTAGRVNYRFESESGEFYWVNEMVKFYDEAKKENYDTAVGKFIDTFGDEALIYLGAKSSLDPGYKGVDASAAYGKWEAENGDLIRIFKTTAPYLAPIGDRGLAMEVWSRQVGRGVRRRNDPVNRLEQAQLRAGSYLYSKFRRENPDATAAEKRAERKRINKMYAGFPVKPVFTVGEYEKWIDDMYKLMKDSRTKNNPVAETIREYLDNRQATLNKLEEVAGVGFSSQKAVVTQYKNTLFKRGEELATINPDFRRVWEQEFSAELE